MPYASWSVVFGEQPSAAKWNILGTNDAYFNTQVGDDFGSGTTSPVWWEEIGRTTLGSAGDTITVSSLPSRKYLMILVSALNSGSINGFLRFNNDTGSNYSRRYSDDGAADTTAVSQTSMLISTSGASQYFHSKIFVVNIATQVKLVNFQAIGGTTSAAAAPTRLEGSGKWANTSDAISRVDAVNLSTGDFATGSEVVVMGHD